MICHAHNDAVLDGLLTVFHTERSTSSLLNVQNDMGILSEYDKECLGILGQVSWSKVLVIFVPVVGTYTCVLEGERESRQ